jgi:protein SCO1/2
MACTNFLEDLGYDASWKVPVGFDLACPSPRFMPLGQSTKTGSGVWNPLGPKERFMLSALLLATTAGALVGADPAGSRLAVICQAPAFSLLTQDDRRLSLADLRGKVILVSFIFTTCNGSCPATTHRLGQVQQELKRRGLEGSTRLVSITLDPTRDTPDVLRNYQRLYDADPATWTFLTGPPEKVARVIASWGMWARPAANGQLDHPSRVFLVDLRGRVREIYNLNYLKAGWVAEDVDLLLREQPIQQGSAREKGSGESKQPRKSP